MAKMASGFTLALFLCLSTVLLISESVAFKYRFRACPRGWTRLGYRCFSVQTRRRTMADAELHCIALGGNLASIHSWWEHHYIRYLIYLKYRSYPHTWIGLHDAVQERHWFWTDGTKVRYTRWGYGEPNNNGRKGEHCTETNFRRYYWNDAPCHWRRPYVCARKL